MTADTAGWEEIAPDGRSMNNRGEGLTGREIFYDHVYSESRIIQLFFELEFNFPSHLKGILVARGIYCKKAAFGFRYVFQPSADCMISRKSLNSLCLILPIYKSVRCGY